MLTGRQIKLRAWQDNDLVFFHELRNDVSSQLVLMGEPRPHTLSDTRRWLESRTAERDQIFFVMQLLEESVAVGFIELRNIRPVHGHAALGVYVAKSVRGRGFGSEALALVTRHAAEVLGLRKIHLYVLDQHERAIRLYERAGFERVGSHRSHFYFAGKYHDVLIMEKMLGGLSQDAALPWTQ